MEIKPGNPIYNSLSQPDAAGSIGGVVLDENGNKVLLTCFHCVFEGHLDWKDTQVAAEFRLCSCDANSQKFGNIEKCLRDDRVDVALIQRTSATQFVEEIPVFGRTNGICYLTEENKGKVWLRKYGAITKDTYGRFEGFIPSFGAIYYGETHLHYLANLIKIRTTDGSAFSAKGDSGSFVLNNKNEVAGVIVMGDGTYSYAMQAAIIETRLNLKFL
jgi:hypothetical protein